jgi:hypothetical protein
MSGLSLVYLRSFNLTLSLSNLSVAKLTNSDTAAVLGKQIVVHYFVSERAPDQSDCLSAQTFKPVQALLTIDTGPAHC